MDSIMFLNILSVEQVSQMARCIYRSWVHVPGSRSMQVGRKGGPRGHPMALLDHQEASVV